MGIVMTSEEANGLMGVGVSVRQTSPLLRALEFWRMQAREELATNCVYFQALTVMLQIPGSARYLYARANDALDDLTESQPETAFDLLAAALDRLGAPELIEQIPGRHGYQPRALPADLTALLASRDRNGLLNVVAECLDALMVWPGIELAEKQPKCVWPPERLAGEHPRRRGQSDTAG